MGEVFLAHDTTLKRRVAIKVLPEAYARDPDRLARFHREAQAVAALNHPNIAAIYDLEESDGISFLVLELVEGDTLAERLQQRAGPFERTPCRSRGKSSKPSKPRTRRASATAISSRPTSRSRRMAWSRCSTSASPSSCNGSATPSRTPRSSTTSPGAVIGSPGYMSPEQARGVDADQRSDIFSFGCVFYELLSGRRAFEGETTSDTLANILKSDVDFSRLPASLPPRLREILTRCLEKDPKQRWHAAADVRFQLASG